MAPKECRKLTAKLCSSRSSIPVGEQATRFRFLSLLLDYEELRKETESKKKHLHEANQKKLKLLSEVRFLRKKYKGLSDNPSKKIIRYGLKKRLNMPSQLIHDGQVSNLFLQSRVPSEQTSCIAGEDAAPSTSLEIDLNQAAEETELNITWETLSINKLKCSTKGKFLNNDPNGVNKVGNRKIKRQDQSLLYKRVK